MENDKTIEVLNTLITINNDRIEGYETASKETNEQDLKTLFGTFIQNSLKCKQELEAEVIMSGGHVAKGTLISGKFFRVWMDVKAALTNKDRKTILNSCEFGEDAMKSTYETTLAYNTELFSAEQKTMIKEQYDLLKADHDKVKLMRDRL